MSIFNGNIAQIYTDMQGGKHPQFRGEMRIIPETPLVEREREREREREKERATERLN